ncbi:MAG: 5-formyltetrahydrofolate cyclo-ligase [Rhizobium sp.]|nr:5-formyltetrahydrofolate cyclo-ligase [Rhizobium sp.]MBX9456380.1 5-formyltetrahydrofolate cyclo-ligase [Rhizobium sp.]
MISKALKAKLRTESLAARDAIGGESRIEKSMAIADAGGGLIDFLPGEEVSGFFPIRSEVDVRPLMQRLKERGAKLSVPVVLDKQTIVFRETARGRPAGQHRLRHVRPRRGCPRRRSRRDAGCRSRLFDRAGHRIGYGAGYYDRAISRLHDKGRRPRLIGVAFDCQEVDIIPAEDHDVAVDAILTESGLRLIAKENS